MEIDKSTKQTYKKDWQLTQSAFDRLLAQLASDRDEAAARYEMIRQKLNKFFQWRGCPYPDDYTDRTIDRVARRIDEGAEVTASDPYLFFHGTAINVLREHWKKTESSRVDALDDLPPAKNPALDPIEVSEKQKEKLEHEIKLECLNECVHSLPPDQIELIQQYHQKEGGAKIVQRKEMANRLKVPLNALRIRCYRIRQELETCILNCTRRLQKV